jgi:cysteine desulfurase
MEDIMLYFDHAASTPPYEEVIDTIMKVMKDFYGNPSSLHRMGLDAEKLLNRARQQIANYMGVKPQEIIFTSGGTESNNMAIQGVARAFSHRGKHVITTEIEHASVHECFRRLADEGFKVTWLPVDHTGAVQVEALEKEIDKETILVSVMHVNNETGRIQPIDKIGEMLRKYPRIFFHVDAVQSIGKIPVKPEQWGIDLMSGSAHKFRGPKGAGLLYKREGVAISPLMSGGKQEFGLRSGTENVPLIVGMAKALRLSSEHWEEHSGKLYGLRERLIGHLKSINGATITGSEKRGDMAPHIVHFSVPGMKPEVVIHALEKYGIYVSTQSACSSAKLKPSRVLLAMGCPRETAESGIRVSMSHEHTEQDIDILAERIRSVIQQLRPVMK